MKRARSYPQVRRHWYRPVEHECAQCGRTLRQVKTLSKRTVVTLAEVIKVTHAGYRCPDEQCPGSQRTYRSVAADALALPGFTYGLDIVLLVGRLHLGKHQTVDEVHEELQRDRVCSARCAHWARTVRRAGELLGDRGNESAAGASGGVGRARAGHDQRCPGKPTVRPRTALPTRRAARLPGPRRSRRIERDLRAGHS